MLDKQSIKILKFIRLNVKTTIKQIYSEFGNTDNIKSAVNYLVENDYIRGNSKPYYTQNFFTKEMSEKNYTVGPYEITEKGLYYLEHIRSERFRFWFPIILSNFIAIAALIISILAYIKPLQLPPN